MNIEGKLVKRDINDLTNHFSSALHEHYGAAFEMLEYAVESCPVEIWDDRKDGPPFWHVVYHAMWYLDWYLVNNKREREAFKSRYERISPRLDDSPTEVLTQDQLMSYLLEIKNKAKKRFENLEVNDLIQASIFEWHGKNILSSLLYNLRHLMLHIGTLNLRILRNGVKLDNWVTNALISDSLE